MPDKQYDGVLKDHIASLDRLAKKYQSDEAVLADILEERKLVVLKLGYDVDDNGLYNKVR